MIFDTIWPRLLKKPWFFVYLNDVYSNGQKWGDNTATIDFLFKI